MVGQLAIHIPPEANPANVTQLIAALFRTGERFLSVSELLEFADKLGIGSRPEISSIAQLMGLLCKTEQSIELSATGRAFAAIRSEARGDILHFLMYSSWDRACPANNLPSWAYRRICHDYWDSQAVILTTAYLEQQVTEIINQAETEFDELGLEDTGGISFSSKSLRGARRWLEALQPPVIVDGKFERRDFCPPELMLLAIGFALRDDPDVLDVDILLSRDLREAICRVCLLDPAVFDDTLDWMLPFFPDVIRSTEEDGYYGRYVRLRKRPTMEDIIR
jgi:hypothetical protein